VIYYKTRKTITAFALNVVYIVLHCGSYSVRTFAQYLSSTQFWRVLISANTHYN